MSLLHVFDMDGTLLRGTTAGLQIASRLGCLTELVELEAAFAAGTLSTRGFAEAIARIWHDLSDEVVAEVFHASPWIPGLPEVLADIEARGEHSLVITMSPDFYATRLLEYGAHEVAAARFPPLPLRTVPDPAGVLTPEDKVTITDNVLARHGLTSAECVAYGDAASDLPLFRHLRHTVAVNASDELAAVATISYRGEDLREAYRLGRAQIRRAARQALE